MRDPADGACSTPLLDICPANPRGQGPATSSASRPTAHCSAVVRYPVNICGGLDALVAEHALPRSRRSRYDRDCHCDGARPHISRESLV
ncbi:hypothetical protein PsYK624_130050 [Phanerochaete sordida]|uniref:Uncharacterized protein n=1 Tax=Phanerochaete sordida TaxID=48140 RepID=A0A9P3GNV5_9APHY|nr:hypothetical protein PsYK624_130050 [Phanerochaete sordida]